MSPSPDNPAPSGGPAPSLEILLAEASWIRRVAGALLGTQDAEDLTQEVLTRAIAVRPSLSEGGLRAWLFTVTRRMATRKRQKAQIRERAEQQGARHEAELHDSAGKLELHRKLTQAIAELDVIYRDVLVMRYFEELAPREIAEIMDLPPTTIRKRLSRGLAQLRKRLDHEFEGGRETWSLALLPFMPIPANGGPVNVPSPGSLSAATGFPAALSALMISKTLLGAGTLALLALTAIYMSQHSMGPGALAGTREPLHVTGLSPAPVQNALGAGDEQVPAGAGERLALVLAPQELATGEPRVRVIDQAGAPLAGAVVAWADRELQAHPVALDEHGSAILPESSGASRFWARAPGFADGFSLPAERSDGRGVTLVLEPDRTLSGVLIVDGGWPSKPERLRNQRDETELGFDGWESQLRMQLVSLGALSEDPVTTTEADGSFVLSGLRPGVSGQVQMSRSLLLSNEAGAPVGRMYYPRAPFTEDTQYLVIHALRLPSLRGRVVWKDDLSAVRGVLEYRLEDRSTGQGPETGVQLEADGSFEVGLGLLDEGYRVPPAERATYLMQSHAKLWVNWRDVGALYAEWRFPLLEQEYPLDVGLLQLTRAPSLSVVVVDEQGEPLERATLVTSLGKALSDEFGRADLNSAAGDELLILAAGYKLGRFQTDALRPGTDGIHRLTLEPGVMLSMSLSQERQQELGSGAQIQLAWSQSPFEEAPYVAYDHPEAYSSRLRLAFDRGRFKMGQWSFVKPGQPGKTYFELPRTNPLLVPGLKPGGQLHVRLVDVLGQLLGDQKVTLPSSPGTRNIVLDDLPMFGVSLVVNIQDAAGHPLPNASLYVSSMETVSGRRVVGLGGQPKPGLLRPGKYDLTASAKGYIDRKVAGYQLTADSSPLEFILERSRTLNFLVLDESGQVLRVDWIAATDGAGWKAPTQQPDRPGSVALTLPLRPVEISFQMGTRHWSKWIAADSTEDSVTLPNRGTLLIEFRQPPEAPFARARVRVEIRDGNGETQLRGQFREGAPDSLRLTRDLHPGTYEVEIQLQRDTDSAAGEGPKRRLLYKSELLIEGGQTTRVTPLED